MKFDVHISSGSWDIVITRKRNRWTYGQPENIMPPALPSMPGQRHTNSIIEKHRLFRKLL